MSSREERCLRHESFGTLRNARFLLISLAAPELFPADRTMARLHHKGIWIMLLPGLALLVFSGGSLSYGDDARGG